MSGLRSFSHFYERKCYLCETRTVYPDREPAKRVRFSEPITTNFSPCYFRRMHGGNCTGLCGACGRLSVKLAEKIDSRSAKEDRHGRMLRSASPRYPSRGDDIRVIRLTADQEAVLQEQFNRWPRAPHPADIVLLAAETGLSEADVEAWYAIRLAQWRKEQGLGGNLGLH